MQRAQSMPPRMFAEQSPRIDIPSLHNTSPERLPTVSPTHVREVEGAAEAHQEATARTALEAAEEAEDIERRLQPEVLLVWESLHRAAFRFYHKDLLYDAGVTICTGAEEMEHFLKRWTESLNGEQSWLFDFLESVWKRQVRGADYTDEEQAEQLRDSPHVLNPAGVVRTSAPPALLA